jgi:signal transduction histidine kinase
LSTAQLALKALRVDAGIALPALMVAFGYYLAARLGFVFTLQPHPISTLWPPNALLMAALLLTPARCWWVLVAAVLPAHLLAELQSGVPLAMVLGWYVSNCSEALIGAGLVGAFVRGPLRLDSFRNAGMFLLCGALTAPLVSSFLDAAFVKLIGWGEDGYWDLVRMRFFSNVLAQLTIVPLVVTWATLGVRGWRAQPLARHIEAVVLLLGLLAASLLVFDVPLFDAKLAPALFYAPLPFLLWAAVRLGAGGTATALAVLTFVTIWGTVHGLGPFAGGAPQDTAREMQLFLIAVSVPLLLLAVVLEERARTEREAHEQRLQLAHLSRVGMLGEMSGGLAHELNQPLTAILSNAQAAHQFIVNKAIDDAELLEILRDIIASEHRAGEVISRLRALFKRGETLMERLDANEVVREVMSLARGDLATRSIEAALQLAPGLPPVQADRIQLQQVMLNLIMNAAEAMAGARSENRRLTVRTFAVEGQVHVSFTDHGPGFAPEMHEKLFEPYYTTKRQGLGLGLSISRSIITAHGGRLWGVGTPERGATFHIALPAI